MRIQFAAFADESSKEFQGQIDALRRNDLDFLEIRNVNGRNVTELAASEARQMRDILADQGLTVWSIGSPIGKMDVGGDYGAHLEVYKHTLELANVFGAGRIRLFSFFMPKGARPEDFRQLVLDRMGQLAELATSAGLVACHENEKGIYGDMAARCLELHQAVPRLKAVFDPANFVQCGQDTLSAWEMLAPYVDYLHIKDALADGQVVAPGDGLGNVAAIVEKYIRDGGRVMTLEPHLFSFDSLQKLEREGERSGVGGLHFATAEAAFDFAASKIKKIVEELQ